MTSTHSSGLPEPRRIVIGHQADNSPSVIDDTVPTAELEIGSHAATVFVQPAFEIEPVQAINGAQLPAGGFVQLNGVVTRWIDFPPNVASPLHYTNSVDYIVITEGELDLVLHDGKIIKANKGDVVVQLGSIHQWANRSTDKWARFVAIMLANAPVVVNGVELKDGPLKGTQF